MTPRTLTVMFTDLVGSVKMYQKVSDTVAVDLVKHLDRQVQEALPRFKGTFVKSTGDGQLLTFEEAAGGVKAAAEVHRLCDVLARDRKQDITVRVSIHTGEVIPAENNDIHGNTVNLAARLQSVVGACETCVTGETWALMGPDDRLGFIPHGPEVFKGFFKYTFVYKKPNPNPVTDLTFRPESMGSEETSMLVTEGMPRHQRYALEIEHPELKKTVVIAEGETHVIGRAPECGTQMPDRMFSGSHAAFAVVEGILWCFDLQSTNGVTYRGRRIKRRKPIEKNSTVQLPTGLIQVKLPPQ